MLTPEQCRAARGWLNWKQSDLADRANVGLSTVRDFEKGKRRPIKNNLLAILKAFELVGILPVNDEGGKAIGIAAWAAIVKK
jgi:DNA-binding transcriptional regulator YiaG